MRRLHGAGIVGGLALLLGNCSSPPPSNTKIVMSSLYNKTHIMQERAFYESKSKGNVSLPDWVYALENRTPRDMKYASLPSLDDKGDEIPCGPRALDWILQRCGLKRDGNWINEQRKGGLVRRLLSMVDSKAERITFPAEMEDIACQFGFGVKRYGGVEANLQRVIQEYGSGNEVIVLVALDGWRKQHYAVFDPVIIKRAQNLSYHDGTPLDKPIYEIFSLKKR